MKMIYAVVGMALAAGLAGCAPESTPAPTDGAVVDDDVISDGASCYVGTWQLDVPDYEAQSEAYLLSLGLPIHDMAMTGDGTISFTTDGLVATNVDLTITGVIIAGETSVPVNTRAAYSGSGDWSASADPTVLDLKNWSTVVDADVVIHADAPAVPAIDYTDIPAVTAECSADRLLLQGPGAPVGSLAPLVSVLG